MSTLAVRTRWLVSDSLALAGRNLEHVRQIPEKLLDVTLQPIMFVLLFAYVFGGVINIPDGDYKSYLIAGILVQSLAFGMMGPGVSIATDLGEGMVDRVRSLPTSRSAYLIGHFLAEVGAALVGIAVLVATGFVVGWSIDSSVLEAIGALQLHGLIDAHPEEDFRGLQVFEVGGGQRQHHGAVVRQLRFLLGQRQRLAQQLLGLGRLREQALERPCHRLAAGELVELIDRRRLGGRRRQRRPSQQTAHGHKMS